MIICVVWLPTRSAFYNCSISLLSFDFIYYCRHQRSYYKFIRSVHFLPFEGYYFIRCLRTQIIYLCLLRANINRYFIWCSSSTAQVFFFFNWGTLGVGGNHPSPFLYHTSSKPHELLDGDISSRFKYLPCPCVSTWCFAFFLLYFFWQKSFHYF